MSLVIRKDQMLRQGRLWVNRLWALSPKLVLIRLSLACVIAVYICGAASAQIKFVQITDLHLYDDGQDATENKRAFSASVAKINALIDGGRDYRFVVVTGDIGIEKLVKPFLEEQKELAQQLKSADQKRKIELQEKIDRIDRVIPLNVTSAALEVANLIGQSKVKTWLFLPGNNDLIDEYPRTIKYYRHFISELTNQLLGKEIIDLYPTNDPSTGVYSPDDKFVFISLNNASFKNNNEAMRISDGTDTAAIVSTADLSRCEKLATTEQIEEAADTSNAEEASVVKTTSTQLVHIQQVINRLNASKPRPAYIFHHIPEIDDPHPVLNFDLTLLADRRLKRSDPYALSSWFVDGCVRSRWAQVVTDSRVKGLFAGHLHDWRRDTYKDFHWMVTPDYPSGALSKLHVCPPISVKRQGNQAAQARGFQAVSIDGTGKASVNVFWYDGASGTFPDPGETRIGFIRRGWGVVRSVLGYAWGTIPDYLAFYLLIIVCGYAAINGRKRVTVVSPFHLPSNTQLPFGEHTVANALRDALVEIHKRGKDGGKEDTYSTSGLMTPKLEGIKFSEAASFEVPSRFAVEVKGLSHDAIISFARKVFRKEWVISGDVIGDTNTFRLLARHGTDLWCSSSNPATMEGLRRACGEVALRMLGTIDITLLSAYTTLKASELIKQKKLEEALELMKEAASLLPNNALIAYDLGVAHAKRGDNYKAIAALRRAVELNNNFPEALNNLGIALGTQGKYDDAIQSYKKAISLRPDYYAAHFNLGTMFLQKGQYDEAVRSFEEALKIKSTDPALYFNLGYTFHAQKRYAEAIDSYRNALEKKPDAPDILTNLGISLFDDGQVDEATRVVERAAEIDSDNEGIKQILQQMKEDLVEEDYEDDGA